MIGHFINPTEKAKENEEWRITQKQFLWTDNTLQNSRWKQIRTHESIREIKSLKLCALISLSTVNHVHNCILTFKHWLSTRNDLGATLL